MASPQNVQTWTQWVLQHPFQRLAGLELVHQEAGKAWCRFQVTDSLTDMGGTLSAGLLHGLMETACSLALLPMLDDDEHASTIDVHASVVRVAPKGARIALRAEVMRKGRNVAFVRCEAQTAEGGAGTIATATVTKALGKATSAQF
jgi:acyl-coenzyme A thioesterase PaaI-like protein